MPGAATTREVDKFLGALRPQVEAVIGELETRPDGTLQELHRLQDELAATIEKHKSGARSRKHNDGEVAERTPATRAADPVTKS